MRNGQWLVMWLGLMITSFATAQTSATPPATRVAGPNAVLEDFLNTVHKDDLPGMLDRGIVRVAVTYSKTHYFIDKGKQYGMTSETMQAIETYLRGRFKSRLRGRALSVVFLPVPRNQLFPMLESGLADLAVANLTITPARQKRADFTQPTLRNVAEIIVSGTHVSAPTTLDGLSGKRVVLRKSSSFHQHLSDLNQQLVAQGKAPVIIIPADEYLENEDLLEMLDAGLIDYTVVDQHIAQLWSKIFTHIRVQPELVIKKDGQIAWAVRKGTPQLMAEANRFLQRHKAGTEFGNILRKRYLENPYWAKRALEQQEVTKFKGLVNLFRKYADQYDFDYLILMAQGYQESQLDHNKRSPVGAIGIMQVMPTTGNSLNVGDIHQLDANVHAGSKYMRKLIDQYFSDPEIDQVNQVLFAFAAYNGGPTRIQKMRRKAKAAGLNPNVWFGNVEHIVARNVGQETVRYVSNIAKYYVAYRMVQQQSDEKKARKASASRS